MKSLTGLIDQVQDVEAKAKQESAEAMHPMLRSMMSRSEAFNNGIDLFKAGARSQARLGEALKEAVELIQIDADVNDFHARSCLEEIRRILESKEGASE